MRRARPICTAAASRSPRASATPPTPIPRNWTPADFRPCWRCLMPKSAAKLEPVPAFLPYGRQEICEADIKAVAEALASGWLTTGPRVGDFEKAFAAHCGAKEAVAVNSGTAAL